APFNDVDALVICYASYALIDPYIREGKSYTVKEIAGKYLGDHSEEEIMNDPSLVGKAPLVLRGMAESVRFRDAVLHDFISILNDDRTEQMCAFELDLSDGTTFIAFRGTDDTLLGWHEDFCLSYTTVDAQRSALEYLRKHIRGHRKYRIGGHSKGGNLAIYAALNCPEKHRRILQVYSLDGPGLNPSFIGRDYQKNLASIKDRYIKIVPEFDVVGTIYGSGEKRKVIKSDAFTIMQHSAMSWQVEGDHFISGTPARETELIENGFKTFLRAATPEQCKELTDQLFNAFEKAGVKNVSDFARGGIPLIANTVSEFSRMNDKSKKIADLLLSSFVDEYKQGIMTDTKEFGREVKEKIIEAGKKAIPAKRRASKKTNKQ
ncbi:MAG: DUF2974 domain-containing protein, partial [Erysipelotrichaceae bacterium]|nr:DUF2974 domain-containing protein [Erysipelotrichaceae bacterium]